MAEEQAVKQKGDMVEGYRILDEIGRGAASIIYLVQDPKTKHIWALKHVEKHGPKDQRWLDQALQEHKIAAEFDHEALRKIPKVIKKGNLLSTRELYLVMEYVDGVPLQEYKLETFEAAVSIFSQVAHGLAHMHDRGYIHADMKPNNVVVGPNMDGDVVAKVIDLGQSCRTGTVKPRIQGTPDYIAPEQVHRREITSKTDIYNLGATMYWGFTKRNIPTALPKDDNSLVSSLDDNMIEKPKPVNEVNKRVHPRLNELIMHCVEVDPEKRPESMQWVADRLDLILGILRTMPGGKQDPAASKLGMAAPAEGD